MVGRNHRIHDNGDDGCHIVEGMSERIIEIKVRPNSRVSVLTQAEDGRWLAQLKAAPVEGKANQELIALVARQFGCAKAAVSIRSGASGRLKRVRIQTG